MGLILLLRYRYDVVENAYGLLELVVASMDPSLFAKDWYLQTALAANVRRAATWLVATLAQGLGLEGAIWSLFVASALLTGVALQAMGRALFGPAPWPALFAVLLADRLTALPGANSFWASVISSTTLAMPFALLGWALVLRGQALAAGFCLGLAGLFHFQVGLGALACAALGLAWRPMISWREGLALLGPFALVAGPGLGLLLLALGPSSVSPQAVAEVLVYRAPWHYQPIHWAPALGFWLLGAWLVLGAALAWPLRHRSEHRVVAGLGLGLLLMALWAWVGTHLWAWPLAIKFQPLRLLPLLPILGALYLGHAATPWAQRLLGEGLERRARALVLVAALASAGLALDATWALVRPKHHGAWAKNPYRLRLAATADASFLGLCAWVQSHTPKDAVLLTPPQLEGFRLRARRAIVVDFKNIAFTDPSLLEWDARIRAVGMAQAYPPEAWRSNIGLMAEGYARQNLGQLRQVAAQYGASYVVTQLPKPEATPLFANGAFYVYAAQAHQP